jgi:hypothetical protein
MRIQIVFSTQLPQFIQRPEGSSGIARYFGSYDTVTGRSLAGARQAFSFTLGSSATLTHTWTCGAPR